jgi:hypothetical protein
MRDIKITLFQLIFNVKARNHFLSHYSQRMSKPIKRKGRIRSLQLWGRSRSAEKVSFKSSGVLDLLGERSLPHKEDGLKPAEINKVSRQLTGKLPLRHDQSVTDSYPSDLPFSSSWSSSSSFLGTSSCGYKKEVDKRLLCMYCSKRKRCILFYPCNHLLTCYMCYKCLDECPACDTKVEEALSLK